MINNEVPYRYYNDSALANNAYKAFTINTTEKTTSVTADRSTNFLKVEVTYSSGTTSSANTLSATLHLCISAFTGGSPYFRFYPEGRVDSYIFTISGGSGVDDAKFSDLKYPDVANYYNYFQIYFSVESGGDIGVNINTPNVNGKLLVECTQMYFKI